jgi:Zn-dependent protease
MNIALTIFAALAFHLIDYLPGTAAPWVAENLKNALITNVVLAVFNLFPLPPLDGGRIARGSIAYRFTKEGGHSALSRGYSSRRRQLTTQKLDSVPAFRRECRKDLPRTAS